MLTPVGLGTPLEEAHQQIEIGGEHYLVVPPLRAEVTFLRAWKADTFGNLSYRMTEQNFNRAMATASDLVIAEVETIVPAGELSPGEIDTPGCYVDFLVQADLSMEHLGTSATPAAGATPEKLQIAQRAVAELQPGEVVNLGIGIPTLITDLISPESGIIVHSENGMLRVGPAPERGGAMEFPVNAGKLPVTALPGTSYFDSAESFAMIRGGHVDVAIMGGLQVDQHGNLANWAVPGRPLLGVGGAMDLALGAGRLIITMLHSQPDGTPKLVEKCSLPLTARNAVDQVVTERAVFEFAAGHMVLVDLMPGETEASVRAATEAEFEVKLRK